jgi:hypothetical protein
MGLDIYSRLYARLLVRSGFGRDYIIIGWEIYRWRGERESFLTDYSTRPRLSGVRLRELEVAMSGTPVSDNYLDESQMSVERARP